MIPLIVLGDELYVEFRVLTSLASKTVSRSTLHRRLVRSVNRKTYGNKKLVLYRDILTHPVLSKIIDKHDLHLDKPFTLTSVCRSKLTTPVPV